jgi:hypothetical protein
VGAVHDCETAVTRHPGIHRRRTNGQRPYNQPTGASFEALIDVIPFGKLETPERAIAWPPDADVVMNVAAFSAVFENSLRVQVCPNSSPDRHEGRNVQDVRRLSETYTDAGNVNRLPVEEADDCELTSIPPWQEPFS